MRTRLSVALLFVVAVFSPARVEAADAAYHHIHLTVTNGDVAAQWYIRHLGCAAVPGRTDAAQCGEVQLLFIARPARGGNEGTAVDHISVSVPDLAAKIKELHAVGVAGSGVRIVDRDTPIREEPGLFRFAFIKDPWGTKIEIVEDPAQLGFHHIHLFSADPDATLKRYQNAFGGTPGRLKGRLNGLLYGKTWLIVAKNPNAGALQPTEGRAIDHIGFAYSNPEAAIAELKQRRVQVLEEPAAVDGYGLRAAMIAGPDNLRIEGVVEVVARAAGPAGATGGAPAGSGAPATAWRAPRTPWDEPDLQGIWTVNDTHGVPLERPKELTGKEQLTPAEAAARRERATQAGIWGYDREWRDTALGFVKTSPSQQVALVVDPPDGRIPPLTPQGRKRVAERAAAGSGLVEGSSEELRPGIWADDLSPVRALHLAWPARSVAADRLQQRRADHPGPRLRRGHQGDDPRSARDPDRQPAAARIEADTVPRGFARAVGGGHARRGSDQLQRPDRVPGLGEGPSPDRTLHAHRPRHDRLPRHHRGPRHVDQAVDDRLPDQEGRHAVPARRVLVPRRELRPREYPDGGSRAGERASGCAEAEVGLLNSSEG